MPTPWRRVPRERIGRRPMRSESFPASGAMTSGMAVHGKRRRPVCIGEEPRPNWKYWATRKTEAESVPIIKKPGELAPKKGRDRKSLKGNLGTVARPSHARNAHK